MKDVLSKTNSFLRQRRNKIKIRAIIILGFLLLLNTYAWFMFAINVGTDMTAKVSAWDVAFFEDGEEVSEIVINVTDMYPGMTDFTKTYSVKNQSEKKANFLFKIKEFTLFGTTYTLQNEDYANDELLSVLESEFPFKIEFTSTSTTLNANGELSFQVLVEWDYESLNDYVKLNEYYTYFPGFKFYEKNGTNYNETTVISEEFATKVENGLYLEADDADSYWGERSSKYKSQYPSEPSIILKLELRAEQSLN